MKIRVVDNNREWYTREIDPSDDWDAGDSAMDLDVVRLEVVTDKSHWQIETPFDLRVCETAYLVSAKYRTGSTFGSCEAVEYVDVFKTYEDARSLADLIEKDGENDEFNTLYYINDGADRSIYTGSWKGYFEQLLSVTIHDVPVVLADKSRA